MIEGAEEFVRHIFPIIVYQIPIENNQELKEAYLTKIQQTYDLCPTDPPKDWLTTKMHTSFHTPDLNQIVFGNDFPSRMYLNQIDKVFDGRWVGQIQQYWFNYYVDGEFQEKHHHCSPTGNDNPQFSCIHFLQFDPKRHVSPTFCDPLAQLKSSSINVRQWSAGNVITPPVQEGDLLVFPSYLEHAVKPSPPTPDYPRITISFNVRVTEYSPI